MQTHVPTTPFGQRSLSLAHIGAEVAARRASPETAVHKWTLFRAICAAKVRIGVSDRALAVLDALLSFHPETALAGGDGLVVFPSNEQLARRAHGMAASTLRRHLAQLVDLGLIVRRDSPNGKRYARKGADGVIETAFGFDLAPLVARAAEFERLAAEIEAEDRARRLARERLTLLRRDLAKMIATGIEERVPVRRRGVPGHGVSGQGQGIGSWIEIEALYRATLARLPRTAPRAALEAVADDLALLAEEVFNILQDHLNRTNPGGNESRSGRHIQNSKPEASPDLELSLREGEVARPAGSGEAKPALDHGLRMIDAAELDPAGPAASTGQGRAAAGSPWPSSEGRAADRAGTDGGGRSASMGGAEHGGRGASHGAAPGRPHWPLGFVLDACPDIAAFAKGGIGHWRDLVATASVVRSMLGISPSAWDEACAVLGETDAAITVAAIFQRADEIRAPGGYLRSLTAKARTGGFSLGPVLMALAARRTRSDRGTAARSA